MKRILVPIDFSLNSLKTLDYVIENAQNTAVEIILVWVNGVRSKDILISENEEKATENAAVSRLENIVAEYSSKLPNGKISYRIREGKVHVEVANQAKYDDVNLVVCGTHGASGFEEHFVGSNAYRIVMYCQCPVITVRPNYRFNAPSHIFVVAMDSSAETRQKVPVVCNLAKMFGAKIHLLGLYSSKLSSIRRKVDNYVGQSEKYILEEGLQYSTVFQETDNLTKTIVAYAESVDADLIAIMTEQESSALSFLLGTYAERMIASSEIPVLSVTPKVLTSSFLS